MLAQLLVRPSGVLKIRKAVYRSLPLQDVTHISCASTGALHRLMRVILPVCFLKLLLIPFRLFYILSELAEKQNLYYHENANGNNV